MKKLTCFILAMALLMTSAVALAETKTIYPEEYRSDYKQMVVGENEVEDGISPTTGLTLSEVKKNALEGFRGLAVTGRYQPMMVQIDNTDGGVDVEKLAPWGAAYADIVYETMLYQGGSTRLTFLFSDLIPTNVGPVRSARLGHVWLREEWGAGFLFYGQQEYERTNVPEEFRKLGHQIIFDPLLFSGLVSEDKPWKKYYVRRAGLSSPHNVDANVAAMYDLIPDDNIAPNHAFKFTDDVPKGDTALNVTVSWRDTNARYPYASDLVYDEASNSYMRYMITGQDEYEPWVDKDEGSQIGFANVIIQFTYTEFKGTDAPVQHVINTSKYSKQSKTYTERAKGNAEYFMAGKHVSGTWRRNTSDDRTVYYDENGNEISLQRGKTLIIIFPGLYSSESGKNASKTGYGNYLTYSDKIPDELRK